LKKEKKAEKRKKAKKLKCVSKSKSKVENILYLKKE